MQTPDIKYTVPPEQRAEKFREIQQSEVYKYFLEEHKPEELRFLHTEIEEILEEGISFEELLTTGMDGEGMNYYDYRKVAIFCFVETLADFVDDIHRRTSDLQENADFNEAYQSTLQQIVDYLHGIIPKFPHEAVRCLFLLTDGDLDIHRQGMTAVRLIMDSFSFCHSEEQKEEMERLINACKI
jgi:hypothetical protein